MWHTSRLIIPPCMNLDDQQQQALQDASRLPPITKDTLHELDLNCIQYNTSLRIDVNFDPELHFVPITGVRAEEKRKSAQVYWTALAIELQIYLHNARSCQECLDREDCQRFDFPHRLPEMFDTVRNLLVTLVPDREQDQIAQRLDVTFLMQQVEHGVFNAAGISNWLAGLLTCHCAPVRDEMAKDMSRMIQDGAANSNMKTIVQGLEKLFNFLEAMRLDVANHQIRTFKYVLIDDTVPYQLNYFKQKISRSCLDLGPVKCWFTRVARDHRGRARESICPQLSSPFACFMHGLVRLCYPPSEYDSQEVSGIPLTLRFDQARIRCLRFEIQDLAYLELCEHVSDELASRSGCLSHFTSRSRQDLRNRLLTIVDREGDVEEVMDVWKTNAMVIATEVTRHTYRTCYGSLHLVPNEEFVAAAKHVEEVVRSGLVETASGLLCEIERLAWGYTQLFMQMSTRDICEAQRVWHQARPSALHRRDEPDRTDIARRLAHMGTLHWQVWGSIAYLPALEAFGHQHSSEEASEWLRRCTNDEEYDTGHAWRTSGYYEAYHTDGKRRTSMGKCADEDLLETN